LQYIPVDSNKKHYCDDNEKPLPIHIQCIWVHEEQRFYRTVYEQNICPGKEREGIQTMKREIFDDHLQKL